MGDQTQTQYDDCGNKTVTTDANGNSTYFYFDLENRQVLSVDPMGNQQLPSTGPRAIPIGSINAIGALTQTVYDADGRAIQQIDPLGHITQTQYDAAGEAVATTDARGETSRTLLRRRRPPDGDYRSGRRREAVGL